MEAAALQPDPLAAMLDGYAPPPGVADEMLDATGAPRPVWHGFLAHLAGLDPDRRAAGFARAEQYLRDAGVFYRLYADTGAGERDWPLSHIPVIIDEAEWAGVAAGLIQRAELLERVVADLYGPGRLVAEGHLPAPLVAANPEWLRPLVGVRPASGHFLHFLAFELGRNPDGSWFVMGDRTQAPSGSGFALETRMATARAFADFYPGAGVQRLAGFFAELRAAFAGLRQSPQGRIGILTPGAMNDTYFEHAYIARHLGFTLLEGEDMGVEGGRLTMRTVAGPLPVEVLWRRLDAGFADPLELDPASRLGTPGLVSAVRAGTVAMVNALGSGVLEARAMMAFLPRLSQVLLGAPLQLPNIATWWCGQPEAQAEVAARAEGLVIGPAHATALPFEPGPACAPTAGEDPARWLSRAGAGLAAQERVTISTAPALVEGRLRPRPMSLRAFALRTPAGWQVMPGGFARIGRADDATAIALQQGGAVADVWVLGRARPAPAPGLVALLPEPAAPGDADLPARAADNLFWLGRYVERAEHGLRQLRAWHLRLAEAGGPATVDDRPLLQALAAHLARQGLDPAAPLAQGLSAPLGAARGCAAKLRDRFSTDGWMALDMLAREAARLAAEPGEEAARALARLLPRIAAFSGLVHDNMLRATGWRFLTLGRALERADAMAWTLAALADDGAPEGGLDLAVELADSTLSHRRRHGADMARGSVVDLLALDPDNPRAVRFQLDRIRTQLARLPQPPGPGRSGPAQRIALRLQTRIATATPDELDTPALLALRGDLARLSEAIAADWFH
jgi:uncharacterized circularly permuted ATP-grasp superfamily protein/uncharacterized alpha-E superfamily protein